VAPGTFGDHLEAGLRQRGATLGHWPQSIAMSTVGGWLACRSAGQYSTRYGKVEDMVSGLEVALADGTVLRTGGRAPRAATGPDLTQLFVGSEGTLGVITSARLRVHMAPETERSGAWGFPDVPAGLDACRRILRRGATPAVLRLYDGVESTRSFGLDTCVLVVLDEGDPVATGGTWQVVAEEVGGADRLDDGVVDRWLERRNHVADLGELAAAGIVADTVEVAASWTALPGLYAAALAAVEAVDGTLAVSAHQSHAYRDGACLYFTFAGRPGAEDAEGYYTAVWDAVAEATLAAGGALSHHHGIGINRGRHMDAALDGGLAVLGAVKGALDPHGILNPGKLGLGSPWGAPPWP
jgi:alkyldihydroxyacetonephosphate synthase